MRWKLPGEDLITGRSSCQLRRATKGNTGSGNAGVTDWFLVITFELVQSCDAGWLNRSETLSKVTAYLGTSTLPVLTATLKSGWKMLQLHSPTPAVTSGTSDLLNTIKGVSHCEHHAQHTAWGREARRSPCCSAHPWLGQAGGGKPQPGTSTVCKGPGGDVWFIEANCKTKGLPCPSPLFAALRYNDYRSTFDELYKQ